MRLRDVFGPELADRVLTLPLDPRNFGIRLPEGIEVEGETDPNCGCIVGVCNILYAEMVNNVSHTDRWPVLGDAIWTIESTADSAMTEEEKAAVEDAIAAWDYLPDAAKKRNGIDRYIGVGERDLIAKEWEEVAREELDWQLGPAEPEERPEFMAAARGQR